MEWEVREVMEVGIWYWVCVLYECGGGRDYIVT